MNRIIFVNRFYWPDTPATGQLLTDLATATARHGHNVLVIASGTRERPRHENHAGVEIARIRSLRGSRATMLGKALEFGSFFFAAAIHLLRTVRRGDTVVAMTDPPLIGIAAAFIARFKSARIVHWVQDVYPDVAIAVTKQRWLILLKPTRNLAWRRSHRLIAVSKDIADSIAAAGVEARRVAVIPNWAPAGLRFIHRDDPAVLDLRHQWGLEGKLVVGYSGNLGRVHALDALIDAAALITNDKIRFVFIGSGAQRQRLESEVERRGLRNVQFRGPQPRDILTASLGVADIHAVTLRPGCEQSVFPSKLYGIAAVGRPVLCIAPLDSELCRIVVDQRLGRAATPNSPKDIADAIEAMFNDPARLGDYREPLAGFAAAHTADAGIADWLPLWAEAYS